MDPLNPISLYGKTKVDAESRFRETKKELNSDENNPLFVSEPIFLHSNIENGYGIFGGQSKSNKAYIPTYFPNNGWLEY